MKIEWFRETYLDDPKDDRKIRDGNKAIYARTEEHMTIPGYIASAFVIAAGAAIFLSALGFIVIAVHEQVVKIAENKGAQLDGIVLWIISALAAVTILLFMYTVARIISRLDGGYD